MGLPLTGGIPPAPKVYRSQVGEDGLLRLPPEVCQTLRLRPSHWADFHVHADGRVDVTHAWPCCQLCGGSYRLRRLAPTFICEKCLKRVQGMDPATPPLPDDVGLWDG